MVQRLEVDCTEAVSATLSGNKKGCGKRGAFSLHCISGRYGKHHLYIWERVEWTLFYLFFLRYGNDQEDAETWFLSILDYFGMILLSSLFFSTKFYLWAVMLQCQGFQHFPGGRQRHCATAAKQQRRGALTAEWSPSDARSPGILGMVPLK